MRSSIDDTDRGVSGWRYPKHSTIGVVVARRLVCVDVAPIKKKTKIFCSKQSEGSIHLQQRNNRRVGEHTEWCGHVLQRVICGA